MRRFWNLPAVPVYSLLTTDSNGGYNMNCCTYVTPVSMEPKQFLIAVYQGTKTLDNLQSNPHQTVVLQLLAQDQGRLIQVLGRQSGYRTNKIQYLQKRGHLDEWRGFPVLKEAAAWAEMQSLGPLMVQHTLQPKATQAPSTLGDHQCWLFGLNSSRVRRDDCLDNATLRRLGLIR